MSRPMPEISGYELLERLGRSEVGEIYRARHLNLGRIVALKVLDPELAETELQRFLREAQSAARLRHPNVVALHDVGHCDASNLHFLALEFVDGPTLKQVLSREKILPEPRALGIALGIAEALTSALENRIVHRDIRPAKILIAPGEVPKLVGLGLSKRQDVMGKTVAGTRRLGSPFYSAPELLEEGSRTVDGRADLYSLGMTLFRALVGNLPYANRPVLERRAALREEGVPLASRVNPKVSAEASRLVRELCAWNPDDRVPDAHSLVRALRRLGARPSSPGDSTDEGSSEEFLLDTRRFRMPVTIEIVVEKNGEVLFRQSFESDKVVIGRGLGCDLRIDDPVISRRHAQLRLSQGKLRVAPLSTTNDTSLNGLSISESSAISTGDEVLLSHEIVLRIEWSYDEDDEPETPTTNWEGRPEPKDEVEGPDDATASINVDKLQRAAPAIDERLLETNPPDGTRVLSSAAVRVVEPLNPVDESNDDGEPTRKLLRRRGAEEQDEEASHREVKPKPTPARPLADDAGAGGPGPCESDQGAEARPKEDERTRRILPAHENPAGYLLYDCRDQKGPVAVEQIFQIGSGQSCELTIPRPAPRKCAVVFRCHGDLWLVNVAPDPDWLTLNGEPMIDRAKLSEGDTFKIGEVEVRYSHRP